MASVKLDLHNLTDQQVLDQANAHDTAVKGSPVSADANPSNTDFAGIIGEFSDTIDAQKTADQNAKLATNNKKTARAALEAALASRAKWAELKTNGDENGLVGMAFEVRSAAVHPQSIARVENLSITFGDNAGELDLHWNPVAQRKMYEVQVKTGAGAWAQAALVSASKVTLHDLPSDQTVSIRVRALGAKLQGEWSQVSNSPVP